MMRTCFTCRRVLERGLLSCILVNILLLILPLDVSGTPLSLQAVLDLAQRLDSGELSEADLRNELQLHGLDFGLTDTNTKVLRLKLKARADKTIDFIKDEVAPLTFNGSDDPGRKEITSREEEEEGKPLKFDFRMRNDSGTHDVRFGAVFGEILGVEYGFPGGDVLETETTHAMTDFALCDKKSYLHKKEFTCLGMNGEDFLKAPWCLASKHTSGNPVILGKSSERRFSITACCSGHKECAPYAQTMYVRFVVPYLMGPTRRFVRSDKIYAIHFGGNPSAKALTDKELPLNGYVLKYGTEYPIRQQKSRDLEKDIEVAIKTGNSDSMDGVFQKLRTLQILESPRVTELAKQYVKFAFKDAKKWTDSSDALSSVWVGEMNFYVQLVRPVMRCSRGEDDFLWPDYVEEDDSRKGLFGEEGQWAAQWATVLDILMKNDSAWFMGWEQSVHDIGIIRAFLGQGPIVESDSDNK
jgi:hypothetical protein